MDWVREHVDADTPEGQLAIAYATMTAELTTLTGQLTDRCGRCQHGPIGCCDRHGRHALGMPEHLLRLQEVEAARQGFAPTKRPQRCEFHGDRGCTLTLFRATICYSFFCQELIAELCEADGEELVMPFMNAIAAVYEGPSLKADPAATLANLEIALAAGRALVAHHRRATEPPVEPGRTRLPIVR
jgi:hypothetical protein